MNKKKILNATLLGFFACFLASSLAIGLSSRTEEKQFTPTKSSLARLDEPDYASDFADSVQLGRNELVVDVQSLTSTPDSKSATLSFSSSRLTGWATPKKNAYIVIDDADYSGSQMKPSISGVANPVFDGYTIEMNNIATFTFDYTPDGGERVTIKEFIVPKTVTYAGSFSVANKKIISDAFIFSEGLQDAAFECLIIPSGIETIESKAIQNVPTNLKILCEDAAKPAGWADDWCDVDWNDPEKVEWGYALKGQETTGRARNNETDQLDQSIGTGTKSYGDLVPSASNGVVYSIVNDVNWSGDFDNPVRSAAGLITPYQLDSYVCLLDDLPGQSEIVVPEKLVYNADLELQILTISSHALDFVLNEENVYEGDLTTIVIPNGVEVIESKAFTNVPDSVTIKCEATSKPDLWSDTWCDAKNVEWGYAFDDAARSSDITSTERNFRLGNDATTYIIGYKYTQKNKFYCKDEDAYFYQEELVGGKSPEGHDVVELVDKTPEYNLPLVVSYDVKDTSTNTTRKVWKELPLSSEEATSNSISYYDSVKTEPVSRSFDILLAEHEEFLEESVCVYNIFRLKSVKIKSQVVENGDVVEKYQTYRIPDTGVVFSANAMKRYEREININEVVNYKFEGLTKFFNYSMISMSINKVLPSYWYTGISSDIITSFESKINDGSFSIRYAIYNINNSFYRLTYYSPTKGEEVTVTTAITTPNSVVVLDKDNGNKVSFLINNNDISYKDGNNIVRDFDIANLKQFEVIGFTINIHLWNNAQSIKVGRTDLSMHFGSVDVMPYTQGSTPVYNVFTFVLIFELVLLVVYAVAAVVLFFVLKEKYKNDEFRRMKPKKYVKTAILGYLGLLVISLTIIFIAFRGGLFKNSVSTHNPIDVFIVIPGIISIVVIGYFIKFLVAKLKTNKQRKKISKLKLNENAADDGTK